VLAHPRQRRDPEIGRLLHGAGEAVELRLLQVDQQLLGAARGQLLVGGGVAGDEAGGGDGEDGGEGHEPTQPRASGHGAILTRIRQNRSGRRNTLVIGLGSLVIGLTSGVSVSSRYQS
jgi:hypothetical protein